MNQDAHRPLRTRAGCRGAGVRNPGPRDHDISGDQPPEERRFTVFQVAGSDGHPNDAPATDLGAAQTPRQHGPERCVPAGRADPDGLEAQYIHLPVPLLAVEEAPASIQARRCV